VSDRTALGEAPKSRFPTILKVLLAATSALLAATVALTVLLVGRAQHLRELEGRLLAEGELQQALVAMTSSDHAIVPHVDPDIGFVLNPAIERATFGAAEGSSYPINTMGLRGPEIETPGPDVTRVVLVGDSVVFGWRIADENRIGESMTRIIASGLGPGRVEVVSVALPSWNTRSEAAFLRRNFHLLNPDVVVWNLLRNDILDVAAAIPPGVLGMYASPHKRALEPFACQSDYQFELPLPSIIARWDENLRRISRFNRDYGVPGLLLSWMPATRAHIEHLLRRNQFDLPVIHLPGFYRYHERWPVSASDPHPSPWATHAIAVGVVAELIELELIPGFQLEPTDREIAERWRATGPTTTEAAAALLRERLAMVPNRIDADEPRTHVGVVYGVSNGWMSANGLLCVRGGPVTEQLTLELDVPDFLRPAPPLIASFTTRNLLGHEVSVEVEVPVGQSHHLVPLPLCGGPDFVWELEWSFDWAFSLNERRCASARLLRAEAL